MSMRPKSAIVMTDAIAFPRILLVDVMFSGVSSEVTSNCEAAGWCGCYPYLVDIAGQNESEFRTNMFRWRYIE
jgi:hypothetical protein